MKEDNIMNHVSIFLYRIGEGIKMHVIKLTLKKSLIRTAVNSSLMTGKCSAKYETTLQAQ